MTTDIAVQGLRWDATLGQEIIEDFEYDGGNSSSRLFERSRIKALAGEASLHQTFVLSSRDFPMLREYLL